MVVLETRYVYVYIYFVFFFTKNAPYVRKSIRLPLYQRGTKLLNQSYAANLHGIFIRIPLNLNIFLNMMESKQS
jgi:hypothetical protein